jgi:deazaflavin-dependent oxidoreductase (nitroreductase family)
VRADILGSGLMGAMFEAISVVEGVKATAFNTGVHMAKHNDALEDRLSRSREIDISVTGRKSGRRISIPVWFVLDEDRLYLLPVYGSDTQWYKNVLKNPSIRIDARGAEAEVKVVFITDATQVSSVVEKFRHKYGASDVRKYYSKFDVAVFAQMAKTRL